MIPISTNSTLLNRLAQQHLAQIRLELGATEFDRINDTIQETLRKAREPNYDIYNFEYIITASPQILKKIKAFDILLNKKKVLKKIPKLYKKFSQISTSLGPLINGKRYNASYIIKELDIQTCVYCNRNYIYDISDEKYGTRRTSEIDHFYSKSKFPFLSISFYNLIPSCKTCNFFKKDYEISLNPYELDSYSAIFFHVEVSNLKELYNFSGKQLRIKPIGPYSMKENIEKLRLEKLYECHEEQARESIDKARIFASNYHKRLIDNKIFEGFIAEEDIYRYFFNTHYDDDKLHKRPLSKLNRDIFDQFTKKD